jgi:hypothetical protein
MAHSYLIFDFGKAEETAQQARHKVENWKQGFRLGNKIAIKFEREAPEEENEAAEENAEPSTKHPAEKHSKASKHGAKKKSSAKGAKASEGGTDEEESNANVRVIVRLDFSDHEKLSLQRWLDRIPTEEPFKSVEATIIRQGDPEFGETNELFETLG